MNARRLTALITGASSGIGLSLARRFAEAGYDVILVSEQTAELKEAARELHLAFPKLSIDTIPMDLTQENAPADLYAQLRMIRIDVLVNDAGVGQRDHFIDIPLEKHLEVIKLNVVALTMLTRLFAADMVKRGGGKILNLGSIAGFEPGPLLAVYHATKAFVVSFSEAIADELRDQNVTVTCLCPGPTATHFFARADMEQTKVYQERKLMDPDEVAAAGFDGLMAGELIVVPGAQNKVMTFMRRITPIGTQAKMNRKQYETVTE